MKSNLIIVLAIATFAMFLAAGCGDYEDSDMDSDSYEMSNDDDTNDDNFAFENKPDPEADGDDPADLFNDRPGEISNTAEFVDEPEDGNLLPADGWVDGKPADEFDDGENDRLRPPVKPEDGEDIIDPASPNSRDEFGDIIDTKSNGDLEPLKPEEMDEGDLELDPAALTPKEQAVLAWMIAMAPTPSDLNPEKPVDDEYEEEDDPAGLNPKPDDQEDDPSDLY